MLQVGQGQGMNVRERLRRVLRIRLPAAIPVYFPGDLFLALQIRAEQEGGDFILLYSVDFGDRIAIRESAPQT